MTVSSETDKVSYNCNGSTSVFAYTFKILSDNEIKVQIRTTSTGALTTLVKTTDYTVSGVNVSTGGNITLVSPSTSAPTGTTIILTRNLTKTQDTDYTEYDTFPASSHETALDRLTMITQQMQEQIDRSFKLDPGVSGVTSQFVGTPTASQVLITNTDATGFIFANLSSIPAYNFPAGTGILVQSAASTAIVRTNTGTANEITVTNGNGVSGNPTFSLPTGLTFTGKTITGGTFASNTFTNPTVSGTVTTTASYTTPILLSGSTYADVTDATKKIQFVLSGITTATTRNKTWQDQSGTIYETGGTDVNVADGGTGRSTATAYALLTGGTTSTGAHQSCGTGTSGQVLTSAGSSAVPTYTDVKSIATAPTTQKFTSGSGTCTISAGVKYIEIKMAGGGGGGGGSSTSATNAGAGGNGGDTTFGSDTAGGGTGGSGTGTAAGSGGTATLSAITGLAIAGSDGEPAALLPGTSGTQVWGSGGNGGSSAFGGSGRGGPPNSTTTAGSAGKTNTGGGGGGGQKATANGDISGAGGGSGAVIIGRINSPSATYSYAVGAGGSAGTAGTSGSAGGAGGSGVIIVDEFYV